MVALIYAACYVRVVIATATLEAIAEPTRLRILEAVRTGERSVGELVDKLGMSQPGVSRHLKVLRDAGLVTVRSDAQRRLYRLRSEPLRDLDEWLEPYRAEWSARLDALGRHLERTSVQSRTAPPMKETP
jgi:DNA-binding transcriptional ArsR family regulator